MPDGYGNPLLSELAQASLKILTRRALAPAMGNAVLTRQNIRSRLNLAALLATSALLTGCAGMSFPGMQQASPSASVEAAPMAAEPTPVAVAPLDPINAPAPLAAAPQSDPLLVPAPSQVPPSGSGSQRVALGALAAMPAAGAPTSIMQPPGAKQAPPAPMPAPAAVSSAPAPAPVQQAAAAPPPVVAPAPAQVQAQTEPPAAAPTQPRTRAETVRTSVMSTPQMVQVPVPEARPLSSSPMVLRPPLGRASATRSIIAPAEEPPVDTVIISSQTAPPVAQGREFVPASVVPGQLLQPNLIVGEIPMSAADRNVVQRFETLKRLEQEDLITQEEYTRRRNVNIGALLPYTRDPGGVGLERSVPSSDAIVARLAALRRSFELRSITAAQHALERTMILNALLPEAPQERTDRKPPPQDVLDGAAMVGRLEGYRAQDIITASEFDAERDAIEYALKNGLLPSQDLAAAAKKTAAAKTAASAAKPKAATPATASEVDPLTREITGPVLHLASFRTEESARKAWTEAQTRNKTAFASLYPIIRRVDLGAERGVFYRLMVGTFKSMGDAEAVCILLKQNNQFCRASADGS